MKNIRQRHDMRVRLGKVPKLAVSETLYDVQRLADASG